MTQTPPPKLPSGPPNLLKLGCGCLLAILLVAGGITAVAVGGHDTPAVPAAKVVKAEDQAQVRSSFVNLSQPGGLIMRADEPAGKIYVRPELWNALPFDKKEDAAKIFFVHRALNTDKHGVEILDGMSGKALHRIDLSGLKSAE